jgi:hypothetical protein
MNAPSYLEPKEETLTHWYNPLSEPQKVLVYGDDFRRPIRYSWEPGETKALPSRYDTAIHQVHNGAVIGGLAPQLVRKDKPDLKVDPALKTGPFLDKAAEVEAPKVEAPRTVAPQAKR